MLQYFSSNKAWFVSGNRITKLGTIWRVNVIIRLDYELDIDITVLDGQAKLSMKVAQSFTSFLRMDYAFNVNKQVYHYPVFLLQMYYI